VAARKGVRGGRNWGGDSIKVQTRMGAKRVETAGGNNKKKGCATNILLKSGGNLESRGEARCSKTPTHIKKRTAHNPSKT